MAAMLGRSACWRAAREAARLFGAAGASLQELAVSENMTFLARPAPGEPPVGVLRVCRTGLRSEAELAAEAAWLERIRATTDIPVPEPVRGAGGRHVQRVRVGEAGAPPEVLCTMARYVPGRTLDEYPGGLGPKALEGVGRLAGRLHRQALGWPGSRGLARPRATLASLVGARAAWGPWRLFPGLSEADRGLLGRCCRAACRRAEDYGRSARNFALVHADLRASNIVRGAGGLLAAIDFDDCCHGWLMQDAASSLSFAESSPRAEELMAAWLEGCGRECPLRREDVAEAGTFVVLRRLQLTGWLASRPDAEAGVPRREWAAGTAEVARRYLEGRFMRL